MPQTPSNLEKLDSITNGSYVLTELSRESFTHIPDYKGNASLFGNGFADVVIDRDENGFDMNG